MKREMMNYINILEGYKTAIKNLHWSSSNMNEHKLCDEIADSLASNQDEIAEIIQGIFGQISKKELKPVKYNLSSTKKMLSDLVGETNSFYDKIKGEKFIGLRSVIENFLGELNKFQYLITLCLKEDINKRLKNNIHEQKQIKLSEKELRLLVRESINNVLKTLENEKTCSI